MLVAFWKKIRFLSWLFYHFVIKPSLDGTTHILLKEKKNKDSSFLRSFFVLLYEFIKLLRFFYKEELRLVFKLTLCITVYAVLICRLFS